MLYVVVFFVGVVAGWAACKHRAYLKAKEEAAVADVEQRIKK